MTNAVILFTKAPISGFCKTRLYSFMSKDDAANLQDYLIKKNLEILSSVDVKIFIYLDGEYEFENFDTKKQQGENIGEKMSNALREVLNLGYKKVILIGSDLINLNKDILNLAFDILDNKNVVLSPSNDGGYSLIGLKSSRDDIFKLEKFSTNSVLKNTIEILNDKNLSYGLTPEISDIDTMGDIADYITNSKTKFLAQGEYNANFIYETKGIKKVLRIKMGSQIDVKNPSLYEYNAIKFLEPLNITPKVYEFFDKSVFLPLGGFSMEYLNGRVLNYETDLKIAANLLSKLHSFKSDKSNLKVANKPFLAMFDECKKMSSVYKNFKDKDDEILNMLNTFKTSLKSMGLNDDITSKSVINTELNNSNFIIGKNSYIIDWEKPLIGDKEQDLAHFLVPTTTFFKSDTILSEKQIDIFLNEYSKILNFGEKLFKKYYKFTLFRGFSWCAFAYAQSKTSGIKSPSYEKIKYYLSSEFIGNLKKWLAS
ncbi:TIGR04282 family arsenosugar biosynthesis glycosyltransferase [Campylobacter sputorum]|uniref:TIGR04282 family arsenosugar biosynthesis glycosyltransferase n=1 Tax=Campylobacter sputorum TaxID=206 RepID=UPI001E46F8E4|nr:TIGR04282 family arsenosugar biosynthesis glycosyltransferase [Campylobacter sputorum]